MKAGIGLDLGSSAARLAVVRSTRSGFSLLDFGAEPMHAGDGASDLIDPQAITATVRSLVKSHKLPKGPVSLGMVNQRMVAREVELPWVPQKDLAGALPMLASDLLPMPVEESVLDFLPAEEVIDTDGTRSLRGLLLAANEEIVTLALEAVEQAGLRVDRVDFGPLGALHSVCNSAATGVEGLLDIGATTTSLVVHEGSRPTFVRVMARGGQSLTESLAEQFGIDLDQAQQWKHGVGTLWQSMSPQDRAATHHALDTAAAALIEEIRSSVMFFRTTTGQMLDRLWLVGGGAAQFGLDFQLRDALHADVQRGHPGLHMVNASEVQQVATPQAATAVGLAMGVAA